ncbi:MAG: hypothetical protein CBE00_04580 [Planctomycetaceae bacterium TMED240]|nr:hypothetical protein [Rhodopirellula sp.]OUX07506.1 MAG: hypothetical protein CBE00_04580 [Planctomycetaceae bacterium TMED240]
MFKLASMETTSQTHSQNSRLYPQTSIGKLDNRPKTTRNRTNAKKPCEKHRAARFFSPTGWVAKQLGRRHPVWLTASPSVQAELIGLLAKPATITSFCQNGLLGSACKPPIATYQVKTIPKIDLTLAFH